MSEAMRAAFIESYAVRYHPRPVQWRQGAFYGHAQEHYETWNAALASPEVKALVEAANDFVEQVLKQHPTPRVSFTAIEAALTPFTTEANNEKPQR